MTVQIGYREAAHADLQARRFLASTKDLFTTRRDGTRWTRWKDTWSTANAYFRGLLLPGLKNMDRIAKTVDMPVGQIEAFVRESPWEPEPLQRWLVANVPDSIRHPRAALVVDDFGIVKQGRHSVGVYRQYSGALGKTGNCQVAVNVTYAAPGQTRNNQQKTWPLGTELYLPQAWVEDAHYEDLRAEVHLPTTTRFHTKQEIALRILDRAYQTGLEHAVTIGDSEYGKSEMRRQLRERNQPYVLGIQPGQTRFFWPDVKPVPTQRGHPRVPEHVKPFTARDAAKKATDWVDVEWSRGTKGPLKGRFTRLRVRIVEQPARHRWATDEEAWLLLERRRNELKAYLCWGVDEASLEELVAFAHLRWTIEQFHREAKGYMGVDRFEGRSWRGWNHHVTMVLLAYAFLAQLRAQEPGRARPTFPHTAREIGTARIALDMMRDQGLRKQKARQVAEMVVRRYTEW